MVFNKNAWNIKDKVEIHIRLWSDILRIHFYYIFVPSFDSGYLNKSSKIE